MGPVLGPSALDVIGTVLAEMRTALLRSAGSCCAVGAVLKWAGSRLVVTVTILSSDGDTAGLRGGGVSSGLDGPHGGVLLLQSPAYTPHLHALLQKSTYSLSFFFGLSPVTWGVTWWDTFPELRPPLPLGKAPGR